MNTNVQSSSYERTSPTRVRIALAQTAYLKEGIKLECQTNSNNNKKCSFTVRAIKPLPIELKVEAGNVLRLYKDARVGHSGAGIGTDIGGKPGSY